MCDVGLKIEEKWQYLDSTEILDFQSNKWIGIGFEMPRSLSRHCTVKINATHVLIAGGNAMSFFIRILK